MKKGASCWKVVMPVESDKSLVSREELDELLREVPIPEEEAEEKTVAFLPLAEGEDVREAEDPSEEEIMTLRDTVRQLQIRLEFLEGLFREHVRTCGGPDAGDGIRQTSDRPRSQERRETHPPKLPPETFPPRKERHKRR
ncbi:hypothetical protein [Gorillibacterium sp. CAU 1737]|uniref:hypothetical protein n=1 Tax=Gorillibacterium sp. CAU 1737 TaxID=3140362 RepID=UPI003260CAB9